MRFRPASHLASKTKIGHSIASRSGRARILATATVLTAHGHSRFTERVTGRVMTAAIIDGKVIAAGLRARVADEVTRLKRDHGLTPGLAVVLVGNDSASEIYVRNKHRQTQSAGMASFEHVLPVDVTQDDLLALIAKLNGDPAVHGILVQLPLPKSLNAQTIINALNPAKDVDGLHPNNAGRLAAGLAALSPCTPLGCIMLTKSVHASLEGMNAIVIGRSNLVGRPLVQLLLNENATVTIAHSRSRDLARLCARADLVYAAVGRPEMVRGDWIKPGATVIDVGISRGQGEDGKSKLVGDVAFAEALDVAGAITPVPGGVGPMTVACLLVNTLRAACAIRGLPAPAV
jgi:methylenetetrahydrofolate dehydrogenase (NADP+)/methenyltetrahydrofolate cyclohydrolase